MSGNACPKFLIVTGRVQVSPGHSQVERPDFRVWTLGMGLKWTSKLVCKPIIVFLSVSLKTHIWISHSTWISLSLLFKRKLYIWNWHDIVCSVSKESACTEGDLGSVPGSGRSPGNILQYSRLGNHIDRGAWWAIVHGVARVRHDLVTKLPPFYLNKKKT